MGASKYGMGHLNAFCRFGCADIDAFLASGTVVAGKDFSAVGKREGG
jgi:hypothetical protein